MPLGSDGRLSILELFHGPTAAFQRLRRALSGGVHVTAAQAGAAASDDSRGHLGRHWWRGRRGVSRPAWHRGRGPVSERARLADPGEATHLLGRQRKVLRGARYIRRLPAPREAGVSRPGLREQTELSSANSINLGRLLPQAVYYAATSLAIWRKYGERASFVIPSGISATRRPASGPARSACRSGCRARP